jgi:hypothetical protein
VPYYVMLDCLRTQDYVFASTKLRNLCNASRSLAEADAEVGERVLLDDERIRALGGLIIARCLTADRAAEVARKASSIYASRGIAVESVVEPLADEPFYSGVLSPLLGKMRERKESPSDALVGIPSSILTVPCEVSGRTAAGKVIEQDGKHLRVSAVEHRKWRMKPADDVDLLDASWGGGLEFPETFDGVAAWASAARFDTTAPQSSEQRQVALVFADVNGLGSRLEELADTVDALRNVVVGIPKVIRESLREALTCVLKAPFETRRARGERIDAVPFRLLYLGGDDLCFTVTAAYAMPFTAAFFKEFGERSRVMLSEVLGGDRQGLSMSAGVVIGSYKLPILALRRIGQDLEHRAKAIGRFLATGTGAPPPALIDFHVVKNGVLGKLSAIRAAQGGSVSLDGGPYAVGVNHYPRVHGVDGLLAASASLAGFGGRGKARGLIDLLESRDLFAYREWLDHLSVADHQRWTSACGGLGIMDFGRTPLRDHEWPPRTPIADALGLAPLVQLAQRWQGNA